MKKLLPLALLVCAIGWSVPSTSQIYRGPNSAKEAQKAARKDQKRAAKRQRRAMKRNAKAQRRAAKRRKRGV
jgi:hypothetical protein